MFSAHEAYLIAVTQSLLDRTVSDGQIAQVDTASIAHVLGGRSARFLDAGLDAPLAPTDKIDIFPAVAGGAY
jgi:molybdopterin converting factor small subunit